jgi:hypothetical protein
MGKYFALVSYVCFHTRFPHECSGEVAQRALQLCSLCDGFPKGIVGGAITAFLATQSDIRMMISCWPACTCELLAGRDNHGILTL